MIANVFSVLMAALGGAAALRVSVHYLAKPKGLLDWAVQLSGALTVAIFIFFLTWGHWQKPPVPPGATEPATAPDDSSVAENTGERPPPGA